MATLRTEAGVATNLRGPEDRRLVGLLSKGERDQG